MSAFSTERERHIHLARVYLGQAREFRQHPDFHDLLLEWTAKHRRAAAVSVTPNPNDPQYNLF